jgi:hypothetical protein
MRSNQDIKNQIEVYNSAIKDRESRKKILDDELGRMIAQVEVLEWVIEGGK